MPTRFKLLVITTALAVSSYPLPGQSVAAGVVTFGVEQGVAGTPFMAGLDFTWYEPPVPFLALRAGVDFGLANLDASAITPTIEATGFRAVAADVDVVLSPDHAGRPDAPIGALDPMLFAGLGLRNVVDDGGEITPMVTGAYGGGVSYWFHPVFRLDLDARRWMRLAGPDSLAAGFEREGWSFRVGAAIHVAPRFLGDPARRPEPRVDTVWLRPEADPDAGAEPDGTGAGTDRPGADPADSAGGAGAEAPAWRRMDVGQARRTILERAEDYLGTPYVWGGAEPTPGFDCSGFVQHVFETEGIRLPRPSRVMAQAGRELPPVVDSLLPGDVVFFSETGVPSNITHVGIYAGDRTIVHATGSGGGVAYDDLRTPRGRWFAERLVAAARVIGVPVMATRSQVPITPETWDPVTDGAPPKEGVEPPERPDPGGDDPGG